MSEDFDRMQAFYERMLQQRSANTIPNNTTTNMSETVLTSDSPVTTEIKKARPKKKAVTEENKEVKIENNVSPPKITFSYNRDSLTRDSARRIVELCYGKNFILNYSELIIRFPEFEIKNEHDSSHLIKEFLIKIRFQSNSSGMHSFSESILGARRCLSLREGAAKYTHSHKSSSGSNLYEFTRMCLGGGTPLANAYAELVTFKSELAFYKAMIALKGYVSWESDEGGPYYRLSVFKSFVPNANGTTYRSQVSLNDIQLITISVKVLKYLTTYRLQMSSAVVISCLIDLYNNMPPSDKSFYQYDRAFGYLSPGGNFTPLLDASHRADNLTKSAVKSILESHIRNTETLTFENGYVLKPSWYDAEDAPFFKEDSKNTNELKKQELAVSPRFVETVMTEINSIVDYYKKIKKWAQETP
jgi:hypothetical protein